MQNDEINAVWDKRNEFNTVETLVTIKDAPNITWDGGPCRPYAIRFLHTRFNGGPWQSVVTIYAMRPNAVIGSWFRPDEVYMPPQWLTDLIRQGGPDAEMSVTDRPS